MTTPAKAAANAANARLSTGPRTAEGKAQSSRNALKHGLTAREVVVREDQQEEFNDLRDRMLTDLDPQGAVEIETFNILLHAAWNIRRFRALEAALMVNGLDPVFDESTIKTLDRLHRYHNHALRAYHKAMAELRALQTARALKKVKLDEDEAKEVPILVSVSSFPKRTQAKASRQPVPPVLGPAIVQNEPTAPASEAGTIG